MSFSLKQILPSALISIAPASLANTCFAIQYLSLAEAQRICFPSATNFEQLDTSFSPEQLAEIARNGGSSGMLGAPKIWRVVNEQTHLGYIISDSAIGKHLAIDYVVAVDSARSIIQVEILEYRENYGSEVHNPKWLRQFNNKRSNSKFLLNEDIKNISWATLSSKHLTEAVKRNLVELDVALK